MSLLQAVTAHRWTSLQDALLIVMAMLGATVLAIEYDLLRFGEALGPDGRRIRLEELIALSGLFVGGVITFVLRRKHELRRDRDKDVHLQAKVASLRDKAYRDPLTDLPNRRAIVAALAAAASGPSQDGRIHAVLILDLDGFKRVNDEWGHATGDHVLRLVVERFRAAARPSDILGRLGGDEFAVIAYDIDKHAALAIGNRFISAMRAPVGTESRTHAVGVSIGIALIPEHGITPEEILAKADDAMYCAKSAPGSALVLCGDPTNTRRLVATHVNAGG